MEVFLDCLPCMLRQVLEASRMATDDVDIQQQIIDETFKILPDYRHYACSPELAMVMHQIVNKHTSKSDLYRAIKDRDIAAAKQCYPDLEKFWKDNQSSLYWALKISATGNSLDAAISQSVDMRQVITKELQKPFDQCDLTSFENKLKTASSILIVGDNAGETVFDRILVKFMMPRHVYYAVRNAPIINDAIIEDANNSSLDQYATILSNGCNAPGAILDQCNESFLDLFHKVDLVISKGQGNFEALSGCDRDVYFLLKAKCSVIAKELGVGQNEYVFKCSNS